MQPYFKQRLVISGLGTHKAGAPPRETNAFIHEVFPLPKPFISMSFVTLIFSDKAFHGPVVDGRGQVLYILRTDKESWGTAPTTVSRVNGQQVGELAWGGLTHPQKIHMGSLVFKSLLKRQKEKWYTTSLWLFTDFQGGQYYWKRLEVRELWYHV